MSCGKDGTSSAAGYPENIIYGPPPEVPPFNPELIPAGLRPPADDSRFSGVLRVVPPPPEFDREELQDIRDIATERAVDMKPCAERDALEALARNADILDALYAREDEELRLLEEDEMRRCGLRRRVDDDVMKDDLL
ncbi:hypothetical protein LCGC14_1993710 [marine sediment metagenome]|uniref:Uncharacterized protein n=1 Tax=marine sediment metagenome TaxID=412755 RepID=A0A0F9F533_9ZZZZ